MSTSCWMLWFIHQVHNYPFKALVWGSVWVLCVKNNKKKRPSFPFPPCLRSCYPQGRERSVKGHYEAVSPVCQWPILTERYEGSTPRSPHSTLALDSKDNLLCRSHISANHSLHPAFIHRTSKIEGFTRSWGRQTGSGRLCALYLWREGRVQWNENEFFWRAPWREKSRKAKWLKHGSEPCQPAWLSSDGG